MITPGTHGSTFGGNPIAAAIGHEVVGMLSTGEFQRRSAELGERLDAGLRPLLGHGADAVRTRGLWAGVDLDEAAMTGRECCERLMSHGVLAKEAHGQTVRLAPPLVATESDIDVLIEAFTKTLAG